MGESIDLLSICLWGEHEISISERREQTPALGCGHLCKCFSCSQGWDCDQVC